MSAQGYEVTFASNYTDVDDKIIKTAIEQNVTEKEITDKFIVAYNDVRKGLHADLPAYAPRVTETMDRIIEFIDKMVKMVQLIKWEAMFISELIVIKNMENCLIKVLMI